MEKKIKTIGSVYQTKDYDTFKIMEGNRSVTEKRVIDVKKSVEKVGLLPVPIVVNEWNEIIDGQARFEYCKRNNLDVTFIRVKGLGQKECAALNAYGEKWKLMDYIGSYAQLGNENFIRLYEFIKRHPKYSLRTTLGILLNTSLTSGSTSESLKDGSLQLSESNVTTGEEIVTFLDQFKEVKTNRKEAFYAALIACYRIEEIDNVRLAKKVLERRREFETIATVRECIQIIETVYNDRMKHHLYIETLYLQSLEIKFNGAMPNVWRA